MLHISETQMLALDATALENLKASLKEYLLEFAPDLMRAAGDEGLDAYVEGALESAREHGVHQRGPMRLWVEAGVLIGFSFYDDPQYAPLWPEVDPKDFPMPFAEGLHHGLSEYVETCFGPKRSILVRVLADLLDLRLPDTPETVLALTTILERNWPEKLAWTGEELISQLVGRTSATAAELDIDSSRGRILCAILGVSFGAGFAKDPLYPWLHSRLTADDPADDRIEGVLSALRTYAAAAERNARARGGDGHVR